MDFAPEDEGVFALSLVEQPAYEEAAEFVYLSAEDALLLAFDKETKNIIGYAMVPDVPIFRRNTPLTKDGKPCNIMFAKESIAKAARAFMKNQNNKNITLEHDSKTYDVAVVESWITGATDSRLEEKGIKVHPGGWAVVCSIENPEVLNLIEEGKLNGFSIEGRFSKIEEIKLNTEIFMNEEQIKELTDRIAALETILKELADKLAPVADVAEEAVGAVEEGKAAAVEAAPVEAEAAPGAEEAKKKEEEDAKALQALKAENKKLQAEFTALSAQLKSITDQAGQAKKEPSFFDNFRK